MAQSLALRPFPASQFQFVQSLYSHSFFLITERTLSTKGKPGGRRVRPMWSLATMRPERSRWIGGDFKSAGCFGHAHDAAEGRLYRSRWLRSLQP